MDTQTHHGVWAQFCHPNPHTCVHGRVYKEAKEQFGKVDKASSIYIGYSPYTVVVGDKEIKGDNVMVRIRETGEEKPMKKEDLVSEILKKTKNMPFRPLPLPVKLSRRPIFVG